MDIDARIREILMRSAPVNDNCICTKDDSNNKYKQPLGYVSIQGNNNVVIKIDWMALASVLLLLIALTVHH